MTELFHTIGIGVGTVVSSLALLFSGSALHGQPPVQPASVAVASLPTQHADAAAVATSTGSASRAARVGNSDPPPATTTQPNVPPHAQTAAAGGSHNYVTQEQLVTQLEQAANSLRSLVY